mgnify:CR=1 FL=1
MVESDCNQVRIYSEHFDTEGEYDHVTIDGETYSGSVEIDQIVAPKFTVGFVSDGSVTKTGFELSWSCHIEAQGK